MLLQLVCEEAESGLATPQMLQHYNRVVSTKLMVMFKHNVSMISPGERSPGFDRLVDFIDRNIKLELSAEDLSRQARTFAHCYHVCYSGPLFHFSRSG